VDDVEFSARPPQHRRRRSRASRQSPPEPIVRRVIAKTIADRAASDSAPRSCLELGVAVEKVQNANHAAITLPSRAMFIHTVYFWLTDDANDGARASNF
jgi:hypothetical protein